NKVFALAISFSTVSSDWLITRLYPASLATFSIPAITEDIKVLFSRGTITPMALVLLVRKLLANIFDLYPIWLAVSNMRCFVLLFTAGWSFKALLTVVGEISNSFAMS